jgi:MFS superfamily sulfate permease-like transporter
LATHAPGHPGGFNLSTVVPILGWIRTYDRSRLLRPDVLAGLTVAAFSVPESMAYAGLAGAVAAIVLFSLVRIGLYIAGGILGAVLALVVSGLLGLLDEGFDWGPLILVILGVGGVGFFGHRLGNLIIILATAAAGAFLVVDGLSIL